jgi:alpha-glucosidase (family GH31 glycosyl hydrolase)
MSNLKTPQNKESPLQRKSSSMIIVKMGGVRRGGFVSKGKRQEKVIARLRKLTGVTALHPSESLSTKLAEQRAW